MQGRIPAAKQLNDGYMIRRFLRQRPNEYKTYEQFEAWYRNITGHKMGIRDFMAVTGGKPYDIVSDRRGYKLGRFATASELESFRAYQIGKAKAIIHRVTEVTRNFA